MDDSSPARPAKKRKLNTTTILTDRRPLTSLDAPISPPSGLGPLPKGTALSRAKEQVAITTTALSAKGPKTVASPFQLTWIKDLPDTQNVGAVTLNDLLGDPLIKECWNFNYLHDIDFLLGAFDPDVKDMVQVKVIHGFWKNEDEAQRTALEMRAAAHSNVQLLPPVFLPDHFGTHHSKMLILMRHDDSAQVIIHTANMVKFDWTNMTQAVWKSPFLPKCTNADSGSHKERRGSGSRFKYDLLNYLRAYNTKRKICVPLVAELERYDFSAVRGALVASVPCDQDPITDEGSAWGWPGLKAVLEEIQVDVQPSAQPEVVAQVSTISTLSDNQIDAIKNALSTSSNSRVKPTLKVVFPTADEIRRSLNGYASGNAIHTKMGGPGKTPRTVSQRAKQLASFRPMMSRWAGDSLDTGAKDAGRRRAAPHIKTYVRYTNPSLDCIDWALVTSANLSNQAWGGAVGAKGIVAIKSYEIGVMVWPGLFGPNAKMMPTFKTDIVNDEQDHTVVGFRMPYDTPLVPYTQEDKPFNAIKTYNEPDWQGFQWQAWPE